MHVVDINERMILKADANCVFGTYKRQELQSVG